VHVRKNSFYLRARCAHKNYFYVHGVVFTCIFLFSHAFVLYKYIVKSMRVKNIARKNRKLADLRSYRTYTYLLAVGKRVLAQ